jgi:small subunit ribosomal protein S16
MAIKIRLARGGSKKRPFYRIVAADSRMPRDGRFIERLGTYNPLLPKDSEERVKMNIERIQHWIGLGAQPTDRISRMLEAAGVRSAKTRSNPKSAVPGEKAAKRVEEKAAKATAAAEAASAHVEKPADEPAANVAEETASAEADTPAEEPAKEAAETAADEPEKDADEKAKAE